MEHNYIFDFFYRSEIRVLRYTSYVRGMIMSFIMFTTRSAMFITIFTYILFGNYITAEKVFVITAFYNVVRQTMTVFFPQGVAQVGTIIGLKRKSFYTSFVDSRITCGHFKNTSLYAN